MHWHNNVRKARILRRLFVSAYKLLAVTDVGLPGGMNGRQMADAARVKRKNLKVLFIRGFAEHSISNDGHLEPGTQVLTKPFVLDTLALRIKDLSASP